MEAYSKKFRRDKLAACDAAGCRRAVALRLNVSRSLIRWFKQERLEQDNIVPSTMSSSQELGTRAACLVANLHARANIYFKCFCELP